MRLGIIGLPGAGKTTIFEALTGNSVDPGQRREAHIGTVPVPDHRVGVLSKMYRPRKTIYAQVEYFLPGGASPEGGKSASPWQAVRDCDALIQVTRNFESFDGQAPDPAGDFSELKQELILLDQMVVEKRIERLDLDRKRGKKPDEGEYRLLQACLSTLEAEIPLRQKPELAQERLLRGYAFLSAKPILVLWNNPEEEDSPPSLTQALEDENGLVVRGSLEQEIAQMTPEEAADFRGEYNIADSALERVIRRSYELLGLVSFFTVGDDEVRAWTIARDTVAQEAAGVIHSDLEKGFIRAEAVAYEDLIAAGDYAAARKQGTVRLEGKTYPVQDGDILNIRFNV
ncbi:MAG: DUF933 domain-containing protein [Desulfobacterales bacterium]